MCSLQKWQTAVKYQYLPQKSSIDQATLGIFRYFWHVMEQINY